MSESNANNEVTGDGRCCQHGVVGIGEWWNMPYGTEVHEWVVLDVSDSRVKLGSRKWLPADAMWISKERFFRTGDFMRKGKLKWYWQLLPWKGLVIPYC